MNEVQKILAIFKELGIKHSTDVGYVYILKAENGLYKIGKSSNVKSRINNIKTSSPVKIELYRVFYSSNMTTAEKMLHELFSEFREIGEWFRMGEQELLDLNEYEGDHLLTHCYIS